MNIFVLIPFETETLQMRGFGEDKGENSLKTQFIQIAFCEFCVETILFPLEYS